MCAPHDLGFRVQGHLGDDVLVVDDPEHVEVGLPLGVRGVGLVLVKEIGVCLVPCASSAIQGHDNLTETPDGHLCLLKS